MPTTRFRLDPPHAATKASAFRPARCLTHPLWLTALVLLIINDHLLKGSALPSVLTGKLSDVAGPIVAAALLAVLMRVRTRRGWWLAHLATALGFAAINLVPPVARWLEQVSASTPLPWHITVDPSDLLGLLALPIAMLVIGRVSRRESRPQHAWRNWTRRIAVPVSAMACMATSAPERDPGFEDFPREFGALAIGNDTSEDRLVRVRSLKDTVILDCETVLADPSHTLSRELFGEATTWLLPAGRALPISNSAGLCTAYLIESEGLAPTLLAWHRDRFPDTSVPTGADTTESTLARLSWVNDSWLFLDHLAAFYLRAPDPGSLACEIAPASAGVDWSEIAIGTRDITAIASAPNGCYEMSFEAGPDLVLCIPFAPPFQVGERVSVRSTVLIDGARASDVLEINSAQSTMQVRRGSVLPPGSLRVEAVEACQVQHDECGNSVRVAQLFLDEAGEEVARAGSTTLLAGGEELHLVRVQEMPARDLACAPAADALDYLEYVLTTKLTEQP